MDKPQDLSENTENQNEGVHSSEGKPEKEEVDNTVQNDLQHEKNTSTPLEVNQDAKDGVTDTIPEGTDAEDANENLQDKSEPNIVKPFHQEEKVDDDGSSLLTSDSSDRPSEVTVEGAKATEDEAVKAEKTGHQDAKKLKKLESEEDLSEKHDEHESNDHHEHEEDVDYSHYGKEELVEVIKSLKDANIQKTDKVLKEIKPLFESIRDKERSEALERFIAEGGEEDDFSFRHDELINRFDANYKLLKERKHKFYKDKEEEKDKNLLKKQTLLEKLREFVDADDTDMSFDTFKQMQEEWKAIGPIPGAQVKTLWANYNALVDRFYDNRSIYFELKELDRKKNLKAKIELCEKAEQLSNVEILKDAIRELNELHHEFKHLGPVPKADQEPLWERFKAASDAVYSRRKDYIEKLKHSLDENLVKKDALGNEVQAFIEFDSDRIKEWNEKTKEILELQKRWEGVGGLPRDKAKEINKKFWTAFKTFFNNKSNFFKKLDAQREENLKHKEVLVSEAIGFQDSDDWVNTANQLKELQKKWKEIGPVPEKHRDEIYRRFKAACDHFFDKKRSKNKELEGEYEANLASKNAVCDEIEQLAAVDGIAMESLKNLQEKYNGIGFVPRNAMSSIKKRYSDAVEKFIESVGGVSNSDKEKLKLENQINKLKGGPNADQKIYRKEQAIRKHIHQVENDIALWKNNIEFFANSKTADKLREEFNTKIEKATEELKDLKQQLRIIRSM